MNAMENPSIAPTPDEYELFKVVKQIRQIAHESREEIRRTMGFHDKCEISQSKPNVHVGQTRRSLLLEMGDFPETIQTPWGKVPIVEIGSHNADFCASWAASQLFFKRVEATVAGFSGFSRKYREVLEPITRATELESALKPIPKALLEHHYIGTDVLLVSAKCGNLVLYRVSQADSNKVPESALYDYTKHERPDEEIAIVWKLMEKRYEKERKL